MLNSEFGQRFSLELQAVIDRTLDPLHGLFTELTEERPFRQSSNIRIVRARLAPPAYYRDNAPSAVRTADDGCGAAFDRERAYWSAIGEALERHAGSIYWRDSLVEGTSTDISGPLDLDALIVAGRPEIHRFSSTATYQWATGKDLASGHPVRIPAAMVYLGYRPIAPHEILAQNDSTGLACGKNFKDAALRGLCEIIERDAFAASWLLNRRPPRLHLSDPDTRRLTNSTQSALRSESQTIELFHLAKSFGVHVVVAVVHGSGACSSVGAAAATSLVQAVEKAIAEVLQGWNAISNLPTHDEPLTLEGLKTPFDHLRYYLHPERQTILQDHFAGNETINSEELTSTDATADLSTILASMRADGFQAAAVDLTTNDVADLGLSVVRVVVPGMQPLVFGPACIHVVDDRRLRTWSLAWGLPTREMPKYNPLPHPFP